MSVSIGQVTAPTSPSTIFICTCPPGATVILSSNETTNDVFLGVTASVTSSTGAPLDSNGPTVFTVPQTATAFSLYGCAGTGTHEVGYMVITAN